MTIRRCRTSAVCFSIRLSSLFAITISLNGVSTATAQTNYTLVDISAKFGANLASTATDINNREEVVGITDGRLFHWTAASDMKILTDSVYSVGPSAFIASDGTMAGMHNITGRGFRPVIWQVSDRSERSWEPVAAPAGAIDSLVGFSDTGVALLAYPGSRYFATVNDTVYDVRALVPGFLPYSLNRDGFVVGFLQGNSAAKAGGAMRWPDGRMTMPLGTGNESFIMVAGPRGHFVGYVRPVPGGPQRQFYFGQPDGTVIPLDVPVYPNDFWPTSINASGDMVGFFVYGPSGTSLTIYKPVIYRDGVFVDLNTVTTFPPDWQANGLLFPMAINDAGRIVGRGRKLVNGQLQARAFMLVPAPGTTPTGPDAPRFLTATVSGRSATIQWSPPTFGDVFSYVVEAGSRPGAVDLIDAVYLDYHTVRISGQLTPGTYYVRVRARDIHDRSGPPSNEVVITIQ